MSACTASARPLISVVMAVYNPRLDWLREQLLSLEAQTYPNLELLILDDCSSSVPFQAIEECVAACIHSFPYSISRNESNLGSNRTFEKLTLMAKGEYIAYCDQDDVWLPDKLELLQSELVSSSAELVCSDMYIIDGEDRQIADSITKIRRNHVFYSGENLAEGLLFHNFVTGCTMLMRSTSAKEAVPFCPHMVHDHYLALYAALHGAIRSLPQQLIRYRVHGGNQTGVLAGVKDKESYLELRIREPIRKLLWLQEHLELSENVLLTSEQGLEWLRARETYFSGGYSAGKTVRKYGRFGPRTALFEIAAAHLPESVFMLPIKLIQGR